MKIIHNGFVVMALFLLFLVMPTLNILEQSITSLGLSENFCLRSKLMGFGTLAEIVRMPAGSLVEMEDFSFEWLGELTRFLASKGLLHHLQSFPGNL